MRRLEFNPRRVLARRRAAPDATEGVDAGFTLIELMVVLLIMAILMAIAIPTFLGVRSGAQDRSAQSDVTNAVIALKSIFVNNGTFPTTPTLVAELVGSEPEMTFVVVSNVTTSPAHVVSIGGSNDGNIVVLASESADGRCWYAEVNEEPYRVTPTPLPIYYTYNQGVSYAGTPKGLGGISSCGTGDIYVRTGPNATADFSGWGPTYPN